MALVTLPAPAVFTRNVWTPPAQNQVNRSAWTGARKVVRLPGTPRWRVSAALKTITREIDAWPWIGFFTALEGEANTFLMPWRECQVVGVETVTVGVGGALAGAQQAPIAGMPVAAPFLRTGQALTFLFAGGGRQLVVLTQDLVADVAGTGTAHFRAALRKSVAAGVVVKARYPDGEMAMVGGPVPLPNDEGAYNFAFDAEEAF